MKALVINQDSQVQRMAFQTQQLSSLGIDFQRLPAFTLSGAEDKVYKKFFDTWQRPLTVSEVSCFLSHKKAWQQVLSENKPMLILEDDAWLEASITEVLNELGQLTDVDYVTLEVTRLNRKKVVAKKSEKQFCGVNLLRLYQGRSGAAGYVLWPTGAKKLLKLLGGDKSGVVDKVINSCYSLNAYQVEPGLAIQLDQCSFHGITPPLEVQSTITTKTGVEFVLIDRVRYKARRIAGELKIGINFLKHYFHSDRRHILLSEGFKTETPK